MYYFISFFKLSLSIPDSFLVYINENMVGSFLLSLSVLDFFLVHINKNVFGVLLNKVLDMST